MSEEEKKSIDGEIEKTVAEEKKSVKKDKKPTESDGKKGSAIADIKGEFRKIIWPSKKDLAKQTASVLVTSLIVGIIVVCMNSVYSLALGIFSSWVS